MIDDLARSAASLSSGTFATLTGYQRYSQLDPIHADFVQFCQVYPDYPTWQEAWYAYEQMGGTVLQASHHYTEELAADVSR